jgi:hypothetical protein
MIEPANFDDDTPTLAWADKQWPVPELGPKWLSKVWAAIPAVTKVLLDGDRGSEPVGALDERGSPRTRLRGSAEILQ